MIQVLLSWLLVLPSILCVGFLVTKVWDKFVKTHEIEFNIVIMSGLMGLTVYAQVFSMFYRVSMLASVLLLFIDVVAIILFWGQIVKGVHLTYEKVKTNYYYGFGIAFIMLLFLAVASASSGNNVCFDTDLYHAQAIHWIEEYGVVKGEGLFLRRLAYNSSFFSLQALCSFKWLFGQSLRNVNGLVAFLFLTYDILSFRTIWKGKVALSDALRIVSMLVVYDVSDYKSSSTDLFAMLLGMYILIKWCTYMEEGEENIHKYAWLCMLAVFATTIKLSVAGLIILAIYPIYRLGKERRIKSIIGYVLAGLLIALPFFARNVIISGWLVYPVSVIDLFDVDWKMTKEVLDGDAMEISIWGKELVGNPDTETLIKGLRWVPIWLKSRTIFQRIIWTADVLAIPVTFIYGIIAGHSRKRLDIAVFFVATNVQFLSWFLSAPQIRYGKAWFYLNALMLLGLAYGLINKRVVRTQRERILQSCIAVVLVLLCIQHNFGPIYHHENMLKQVDYTQIECKQYELDGYTVYGPAGDGQVGYHCFPAAGSKPELDRIKLRTENIKDGFTYK